MSDHNGQPAGAGSPSDATADGNMPVYCFDSTNVLVCGYKSDVVQKLRGMVEEAGGAVSTKASQDWQPHVIVCGSSCDSTFRVRSCALNSPRPFPPTTQELYNV
eukprot:GHRQ01023890.1.p1 GENE.GHRQ01023890.1~~GHRQ01023890.1.p1  ORF type:complete len:104 (+),score=21.61 GHRQ01023890.1:812-1123(+)